MPEHGIVCERGAVERLCHREAAEVAIEQAAVVPRGRALLFDEYSQSRGEAGPSSVGVVELRGHALPAGALVRFEQSARGELGVDVDQLCAGPDRRRQG